ncbi:MULTISPECIES: hypothetical protein [Bacillus]|uniref:hypothetical protein n=1 Tax=Bacillus TaxID=1386 RepID=UPI000314924B|nr:MULTISPECIES: hypothetical protein [Bacillus]MCU5441730.1 hypothetical protein [Bacillus cereus]MEC4696422.1 hypothetical protein [Bacillus anthracis]PRP96616.1 hypothetical protein TUN_32780 [Bacillus sp. M21]HDR4605114.1 hypothetical protein [Bacillus cereus]HDR4633694.1 hypothetical protein [Bacillus cereus]
MLLNYASLLFNLTFLIYIFVLMKKVNVLRKENNRLLQESNQFGDLQSEVKYKLRISNEIETIKFLREEKGISMIEAKEIVDSVKMDKK